MDDCRSLLRRIWNIICLLTVEPALFLVSFGSSITGSATKVLFYDKVCIMMLDDIDLCVSRNFTSEDQQISVEQAVSTWGFYQIVVYSLPAIFMNVFYSNLVDRWSKKYTMLFCPAGYILSNIVYMISAMYMDSSPAFTLLGPLFVGISGGLLTMLGACFSYLSATTSASNLIVRISLAEAALLASSSISSFISGVLYDSVGYFYVYLIGIIINVLLAIYILVRLKNIPPVAPGKKSTVPGNCSIAGGTESDACNVPNGNVSKMPGVQPVEVPAGNCFENDILEDEDFHERDTDIISDSYSGSTDPMREPEVPKSRCVCLTLPMAIKTLGMFVKDYVNTVARRREQNKRRAIIAILSIIFFEMMSVVAAGSLCYLFVTQEPLSWSTAIYGYYTGATHIIKGFCLLVILPAFKRLNVPYPMIMIISLMSSIFGQTIFALSLYTWMAFLSAVVTIFQSAVIVTARSFIVSFIEDDEHGKAFGIIASIESLASLLSSAIFNLGIYPATVGIFSGLAILIAAIILVVPLAVAIWLHVFIRRMTRIGLHLQIESQNVDCTDA